MAYDCVRKKEKRITIGVVIRSLKERFLLSLLTVN